MAKDETLLSFVFETFDLSKGELIKEISSDMKKYSEKKGFLVVPDSKHVRVNPPVCYYDVLKVVEKGEKYLSSFTHGQWETALSDMVRLKSFFKSKDVLIFNQTNTFQDLFNEIYDYGMKKGFYVGWFDKNIKVPPVAFFDSDFHIIGGRDKGLDGYITINVDHSSKIVNYAEKKRKEYGYGEPPTQCSTCLSNCTNKEEQKLKNMVEKNNLGDIISG